MVDTTANSIKIAEELHKSKFPEPHDVAARKAKDPKEPLPIFYPTHDSDDEDPDTIGTRASLRQAESMLKTRFFTNETQRKKFEAMKSEGKLRKEVENFEEKDDNEVTDTKEDVKAK